jgi:Flp pilus assembly pilin Flp
MRRHYPLLKRFAQDESGVFAVIFGLMAIVLVALGGAVVDYVTLEQTRTRAQTALDAAVLALQPEINDEAVTEESIRSRAEAIVIERIGDDRIEARVDRISVDRETGRLFLGGDFRMPTAFVNLVGVPELRAAFQAEAMQGAVNMEISLALDITGSMGGNRIVALQEAATELVRTVMQNNGGEATTKVALVPYSQAVNAGDYADALRGPVIQHPISSITWSTGSTKPITGVSTNTPVRITASGHGFQTNQWVYVWGVNGLSNLNNKPYQVRVVNNNVFELVGTSGRSGYSGGGSVVRCINSDCNPVVNSIGHGFSNGDYAYVSDVRGMTGLNGQHWQVSGVTANTLILNGIPAGGGGNYVNGSGQLRCSSYRTAEACPFYRYRTLAGTFRFEELTACVTERRTNPFNDQPPSVSYVGRNYPPASDCPRSSIIPLTTDESALVTAIGDFRIAGTTAGSLGILWSWYMLSPNFGYVWPEDENRPTPYGDDEVVKAAIIMTDGEFNTVHYDGVISRDSDVGNWFERLSFHTENAHNGAPYEQARRYCDAMKAEDVGITVYTVGFDIGTGSRAAEIMTYCASDPAKYYPAANVDELKRAFRQIARSISQLRLTQ